MGKDTKFCRNCGKELPIESTFCPYCMTKLIDVTTGGEIKVKKKKPAGRTAVLVKSSFPTVKSILKTRSQIKTAGQCGI